MTFTYRRTIRFQDTDAAGVVYFANILAICHEAYEESLVAAGINLKSFFSNSNLAIPIVHASVDFFRPLFCGDLVEIQLIPNQISAEKFEINYQIIGGQQIAIAKIITRHVCINPIIRNKEEIPADMIKWLHLWSDSAATL